MAIARRNERLGSFLTGIPNQDLTDEDVAELTDDQKRAMARSGLYDCPTEWADLPGTATGETGSTADLMVGETPPPNEAEGEWLPDEATAVPAAFVTEPAPPEPELPEKAPIISLEPEALEPLTSPLVPEEPEEVGETEN